MSAGTILAWHEDDGMSSLKRSNTFVPSKLSSLAWLLIIVFRQMVPLPISTLQNALWCSVCVCRRPCLHVRFAIANLYLNTRGEKGTGRNLQGGRRTCRAHEGIPGPHPRRHISDFSPAEDINSCWIWRSERLNLNEQSSGLCIRTSNASVLICVIEEVTPQV